MIKSGQAIAGGFPVDSAPDGAITATLIVNGVDNAAELTVTNSGLNYKWAGTAPTLAAGDIVQVRAAGAWDSVAASAIVWSEVADTKLVSGLNDLAAGAQMDLVDAPNATAITGIQSGLATPTNITAASGIQLAANQDVRNVTGNVAGTVGKSAMTLAAGDVTGNLPADVKAFTTQPTVTGATLAAEQHVIVDSGTVTNLTNLPAAPADWLTAAAVKSDAVTKVQSGLATPTNITAGTITTVTNLTNAPAAGDLTAAMKTSVTEAATAATPVVTLASAALTALAAAVWNALTSGLTAAGSVGKLIVDNLNATVGSRLATADYTAPPAAETIQSGLAKTTEVSAIADILTAIKGAGWTDETLVNLKAAVDAVVASVAPEDVQAGLEAQGYTEARAGKLDRLDASVSSVGGVAGPGHVPWPYRVRDAAGNGIADVEVRISTDAAGTVWVAGPLRTNDFGWAEPEPRLFAGTYYFWCRKANVGFATNPDAETVVES